VDRFDFAQQVQPAGVDDDEQVPVAAVDRGPGAVEPGDALQGLVVDRADRLPEARDPIGADPCDRLRRLPSGIHRPSACHEAILVLRIVGDEWPNRRLQVAEPTQSLRRLRGDPSVATVA
jgi:hypothetical protein